jgi:hypothetical protein
MTIPKEIRSNFLLFCVLSVAHRLHKSEDEIASWPLKRLVRWMAYFKIIREEENKQLEEAKRGGSRGSWSKSHLKGGI